MQLIKHLLKKHQIQNFVKRKKKVDKRHALS